jgi:hypothetical protein
MGSAMRQIARFLPLTHVTAAIRQPWLGLGSATWDLAVVAGVLVVSLVGWRRVVAL